MFAPLNPVPGAGPKRVLQLTEPRFHPAGGATDVVHNRGMLNCSAAAREAAVFVAE